jgi:site-specific recombinase XerD
MARACKRPRSLEDLVRRYLVSLARRGLAVLTVKVYSEGLARFLAFLGTRDRSRVEQLDIEQVEAFVAWLTQQRSRIGVRKGQPLHAHTVGVFRDAVRGFCRWLVREGHLLIDPSTSLEVHRVPRDLPRVLTVSEVERLLAVPARRRVLGHRDRAILELFYSSGLRCGELVALDLADVDLVHLEVLVRRGKGSRSRRVPLGERAAAAISLYLKGGRPELVADRSLREPAALFLSLIGSRLSKDMVQWMLRYRRRRAGLEGRVVPHALRHTAAVHLLLGGADLRHIQELLGHLDLESTAHYTRLDIRDLKKTLARCHPRARLKV